MNPTILNNTCNADFINSILMMDNSQKLQLLNQTLNISNLDASLNSPSQFHELQPFRTNMNATNGLNLNQNVSFTADYERNDNSAEDFIEDELNSSKDESTKPKKIRKTIEKNLKRKKVEDYEYIQNPDERRIVKYKRRLGMVEKV